MDRRKMFEDMLAKVGEFLLWRATEEIPTGLSTLEFELALWRIEPEATFFSTRLCAAIDQLDDEDEANESTGN